MKKTKFFLRLTFLLFCGLLACGVLSNLFAQLAMAGAFAGAAHLSRVAFYLSLACAAGLILCGAVLYRRDKSLFSTAGAAASCPKYLSKRAVLLLAGLSLLAQLIIPLAFARPA